MPSQLLQWFCWSICLIEEKIVTHMCTYIYTHAHAYIHVCIYTHKHTHALHIHTFKHTHTPVSLFCLTSNEMFIYKVILTNVSFCAYPAKIALYLTAVWIIHHTDTTSKETEHIAIWLLILLLQLCIIPHFLHPKQRDFKQKLISSH
jgi:hypothetical protein